MGLAGVIAHIFWWRCLRILQPGEKNLFRDCRGANLFSHVSTYVPTTFPPVFREDHKFHICVGEFSKDWFGPENLVGLGGRVSAGHVRFCFFFRGSASQALDEGFWGAVL